MKMKNLVRLALVLAGLGVAACGDDDNETADAGLIPDSGFTADASDLADAAEPDAL
jgi:hypothetical protein